MNKTVLSLCLLLSACSAYNNMTRSCKINTPHSDSNILSDTHTNTAPTIPPNAISYAKIYVISLNQSKQFDSIKNKLNKHDLICNKFQAIQESNLEIQDVTTERFLSASEKRHLWNQKTTRFNVILNGRKLIQICSSKTKFSLKEISTACNHRQIWQEMLNNNYDYVIVLEDNVVLEHDFVSKLKEYIKDLPNDWDIAFLGIGRPHNKYGYFVCVGDIFRDIDNVKDHPFVAKIQPTNLAFGIYGYIINQKGAKKLINLTNILQYPLSFTIFQHGGINANKIKGYVAMKKLLEPKST